MTKRGHSGAIDEIFNDALDLPPEERDVFLQRACGSDLQLLENLRSLVEAAERPLETNECVRWTLDPEASVRVSPPPEVIGRYRILEQIGRGGAGRVFRARHPTLDRDVAIKLLDNPHASEVRLDRFRREAQLLARFDHPNIARVYDFDTDGPHSFLVMELIEGRSLAHVLEAIEFPLERSDASSTERLEMLLRICREIAEGVCAAHELGIVHRDLKPANVMIADEDWVKILDFGIARLAAQTEPNEAVPLGNVSLSTLAGTPAYMSPEQKKGQLVGTAADVWGVGCILFECMTGERVGLRMEDVTFELETELPSGTPAPVRGVIVDCLRPNPEDRPGASDVLERLSSVVKPVVHRRGTRSVSRTRRRTWIVAGTLLAGVAMVVALLFLGTGTPLPQRVDVAGDTVQALDDAGEVVWERTMPGPIALNQSRAAHDLDDIYAPFPIAMDRGLPVGVVVATAPTDKPGRLWFLDARDGEVLWSHEPRWRLPLNANGLSHHGWEQTFDGGNGHSSSILTQIGCGVWYPCAVQLLDLGGEVLGTYHHPGPLWYAGEIETDEPGTKRWLFAGLNSSARLLKELIPFETKLHIGCAVILVPPRGDVQGFPYSEGIAPGRDWPGMKAADEAAYLAVPPIHPKLQSRVFPEFAGRGRESGFSIHTGDGRVYFTDPELRPSRCWVQHGSPADSLHQLGEARFLPVLHVQNGNRTFYDVPLEF